MSDKFISFDSFIFCKAINVLTNLELWHRGEDQHEDGGQQEEGADHHQHLPIQGKRNLVTN